MNGSRLFSPRITRSPLAFGILWSFLVLISQNSGAWEAIIERDALGVPHIRGETDADTAFGLAFAQAEDGWEILEEALPYYRGNAAGYFGRKAVATDYLVKWLGFWEIIERDYSVKLKPETRRYLDAFAAGFNEFARVNPTRIQQDVLPVTPQDVIAAHMFRHLLFYGFDRHIAALRAESRQFKVSTGASLPDTSITLGSNATAIAPSRSQNASTMLMINSHQPLTGPVSWYEVHLKSDEGLDVMGGLFIGAPTLGVGFTQHHGWGVTVNEPDLVDIFVLEIDPKNQNRYRLDGEWHELEQFDIPIKILFWGWLPWSVMETGYRSVHGPVMRTSHGTYAIRYAGMDEIRQVEQWLAINKAKSFDEWQAAMFQQHIASFNFVYANADGIIHFLHNAMMPRRLKGWNWNQYLPGNRSDLIWSDYLRPEELPSITNPPAGFIHSANQTPFHVTSAGGNPDPSNYPVESGWPTRITNRTLRGIELMETDSAVSLEDLVAIKHDNSYSQRYRGYQYLQDIVLLEPETKIEKKALEILGEWDLRTNKSNKGAALGVCILSAEWRSERASTLPPNPRETLKQCIDSLLDLAGELDPMWGDVHRHGRNNQTWAVSGGPDTLRAMYAERLNKNDRHFTTVAGDGLYYIIEWDQYGEQTVLGTHQYGSHMTDPNSPHYLDQAEDFSLEQLRIRTFSPLRNSEKTRIYAVSSP